MASETPEHILSASQNDHDHEHARLLHGDETLSPLEQEVLDEYARLLGNLNTVCLCLRLCLRLFCV
jgi:DASH complex subunit DAD3